MKLKHIGAIVVGGVLFAISYNCAIAVHGTPANSFVEMWFALSSMVSGFAAVALIIAGAVGGFDIDF